MIRRPQRSTRFPYTTLFRSIRNNQSGWEEFGRTIDIWVTSATDAEYTAAGMKEAFDELLKKSPRDAKVAAVAMLEFYRQAQDPRTGQAIKDQVAAWGLNEGALVNWIGQARVAEGQQEVMNGLIEEQNDLVDGLTKAWEDYLGLLDLKSTANDAKNALLNLLYAVDDNTTATDEYFEAQKQAAEEVARFIRTAKDIPKEIQTQMLTDLDAGNLSNVYTPIDTWAKEQNRKSTRLKSSHITKSKAVS